MKTLAFLLCAGVALAQDKGKHAPKVDQGKVDQAIKKGVDYLKSQIGKYGQINSRRSEELILWTLVHAGLGETDPEVAALLKTILETDLQWTYNVSLQAMILEELDRVRYQSRIHQCAQFLVDNQCKNGQWSYGAPSMFVKDIPTTGGGKAVASGGGSKASKSNPAGTRAKPKVVRRVVVQQKRTGPDRGDNSNSQYAALGLRACADAGIELPGPVVELAEKWWRECINAGGWGYQNPGDAGYGSMTAGAVGGLTIYAYIRAHPWMKDKDVLAGMEWIAKNWTVDKNPAAPDEPGQGSWHLYYLYALERMGIFYGTETIGGHDWYVEGANYLLGAQKPDGSWMRGADHAIWDTCFGVLFLRRATRPLRDVATGDPVKR